MAEQTSSKLLAVMGNYQDPNKLLKAAEAIRDGGYTNFDIHTPFPVHGLDKAMGIKKTILPKFALAGAVFGLANAFGLQYWTGAVHYKLNIGGKPLFAVWFGMPVLFELTILFCSLTIFVVMFGVLNKLPKWFSPFQHDAGFRAAVNDQHVVVIEADDAKFDADVLQDLLRKHEANDVRLVYEDQSNIE